MHNSTPLLCWSFACVFALDIPWKHATWECSAVLESHETAVQRVWLLAGWESQGCRRAISVWSGCYSKWSIWRIWRFLCQNSVRFRWGTDYCVHSSPTDIVVIANPAVSRFVCVGWPDCQETCKECWCHRPQSCRQIDRLWGVGRTSWAFIVVNTFWMKAPRFQPLAITSRCQPLAITSSFVILIPFSRGRSYFKITDQFLFKHPQHPLVSRTLNTKREGI